MNERPTPQQTQTYLRKNEKMGDSMSSQDSTISGKQTNGNIFRRGAFFHWYLSTIYTGDALFGVICVKNKKDRFLVSY